MALGYLHGQFESEPGNEVTTPTLSAKEIFFPLQTAKPDLGAQHLSRDDELRNLDEPVPVITETKDPAWEYAGRMYPDLLGFWLKLQLGEPTTTVGDGKIKDPDNTVIPTGAFRHVFKAPFGPSGPSPLTAQLTFAYTDQGVFSQQKGCAVEKLSIASPAQGGVTVNVNGQANYMDPTISDPAESPAYEDLAVRPWTRSNLTLDWLSGSSQDNDDFSIEIDSPVETVRTLGIASEYPDLMLKGEGLITVTGTVSKRTLDPDDFDALRDATGFSATAKWINNSKITGNYPYAVWLEMSNCQYTGGEADALSNSRRIGSNFNFKATNAGSASATITVVNGVSSYA